LNRRIFAYVDTGIPDGVQLDSEGNVYTGCGDGTQVFSPSGILLGKFFIGSVSANMVFAGDGRLVIMGETKILVAMIAAKSVKLSFP
jgi:gluconolactonase